MVYDIEDLVKATLGVIHRCRLDGRGRYKRWAVPGNPHYNDDLNPYGVADAANLLYTINAMPHDAAEQRGFLDALGSRQDAETGLFNEPTHHPYHTTAHCIAAMELFEGLAPHRLTAMMDDATPEGVVARLDGLDWVENPWGHSHQGAGLYVSLKLSRQLDAAAENDFEKVYFDWVTSAFDPESGMLRRGCLPGQHPDAFPIHGHMAGTFHYLFNMESARVALPYPEAMVDTCLAMKRDGTCRGLAETMGFITVDWVYCLNRAVRQSGHRFAEAREAMVDVAEQQVAFMRGLDHARHEGFNDLHALFGCWCALAELQVAVPGLIRTPRPLRLVLDRRPFI